MKRQIGDSAPVPAGTRRNTMTTSTWPEPDDDTVGRILRGASSIAIVGASPRPDRPSNEVGAYLQGTGAYRVYFVNPRADVILGEKAYPDLASLPEVPDIVDVFRRADDVPPVVDEAIAAGASTVWLQLGVWNEAAARAAEAAGLTVVMDRCIKIEHARLLGGARTAG
ncbi:CoA-binding protein [Cryobacterium mannosilyticum]|uniref:CoA-binding protein n=2 Tax=Cryobacterium mannosilyticum TaxID=1259190 RepID=A0A4R8W0H5_9MICO|nr:CoA-binding protein [Cryobacterium mannosilyticum]